LGHIGHPALLTQHGIPDPVYRQRLASQYGRYTHPAGGSYGGAFPGEAEIDRSVSLGYVPHAALIEFQTTGVADETCFPYASPATQFNPTLPCTVCQAWEGRVTKISSWTVLTDSTEMKAWISSKGPLVAAFIVYQDFMDFFRTDNSPDAIYRKGANPVLLGGHCICVIGYSDDDQCWICKNSWGAFWAASGFFKIGYGEAGIDAYMWGVDIW
jgi:hypothetical protein